MSSKDYFKSKLDGIAQQKEEIKQNKSEVINSIIHQDPEPALDMDKIAEELEERGKQEKRGLNQGFTKDTIYVDNSIYKAFNALCTERGMKKRYVNEALSMFIKFKYKELQNENMNKQ